MTRGVETRPSYPLLLATVSLGSVLASLNSTMLAVALPELRRDFSVGHAEIGWLVSAYLIAMAVAQPLGGRLGDQLGRARVFQAGLLAFVVLSIAAASSPTFPVLVLLRTGQALVGAAVIPNGMAMLRETLVPNMLGRSMGLIGGVTSCSAAAGPLLGTGLLALGSWRLLFLMNVPLVAACLACHALLRYPALSLRLRPSLDLVGAAVFGALLVALTLVLSSLNGAANRVALALGAGGLVVLLPTFLRAQRASDVPVVEWRLFRHRSYAAGTSYILLSNLVMYTTLLTVPFFIEELQGKSNTSTGTLLAVMSVLIAVIAPLGGRLSDERGRRLPALAGSLLVLGAVAALLTGISRDVSYGYLAVCLAALGLGMGLSFGAASTAAIESAPRALAGAASGTNSTMRYVGSIIGAGLLGAILSGDATTPGIALYRLIFIVLLAVAVLGTVATVFIHRFPPTTEDDPARLRADAAPAAALGPRSQRVPSDA